MTATTSHDEIIIRRADPADAAALRRLAALDSAGLPDGVLLVAEVDGAVRAALSVTTGEHVSDPFFPTSELVELLAARADTVRATAHVRGERTRARLALWTARRRRTATVRPGV
jgi:hypothetical protein